MGETVVAPLDRILVTSRDYDEYVAMFGLDPDAASSGLVLDCGSGASDFGVSVRERGGHAVSVDPIYARESDALVAMVHTELDRGLARAVEIAQHYDFSWTGGLLRYVERRQRAGDRFLADFARDRADGTGRYVAAALPILPFADATFDLALVPNLLFTYANLFDRRWHLAGIRELVRVSAEVRIHPLTDTTGRRYAELEPLRRELADLGVESEVRPTAYRLHHRDEGTLRCRPAAQQ